ncbi:hypothetical protein GCM10025875_24420 [Litorihabitans aurantiacus]|uniref:Uncharacterized protein n=1 Tax=Litorihabitans aurantiacus TaxID=1930061 RepID=A0AA37XGN7_9MICO|nr:hypothetical protein GCM10025875_24420 [Litorihabitans aurantiacus]
MTWRAFDLPKFIIREFPPCMRDITNQKTPMISARKMNVVRNEDHHGVEGTTELKPCSGSAAAISSATSSACGVTYWNCTLSPRSSPAASVNGSVSVSWTRW